MRDLVRRRRALEAYVKLTSLMADIMRLVAKHKPLDPIAAGYHIQKIEGLGIYAAGEIAFIELLLATRRREVESNLEYYNRMGF